MKKALTEEESKVLALAGQILALAHDDILMHLRFFDTALAGLKRRERAGINCLATDGETLLFDPVYVLKMYQEDPKSVTRCYLHILLHCIFSHGFKYDKMDSDTWDLAVDIAVEN